MKFALVDGSRTAPKPTLSGLCPCCASEVISKCGRQKIWHWAHKNTEHCDTWWEPETEWHRNWKAQFPEAWQEVVQQSENGKLHIADIKVEDGVVVEFQHSHISLDAREEREKFYGDMIWVVDGTRLKKDKPSFFDHLRTKLITSAHAEYLEYEINFHVPTITARWVSSKKPVYFDFGEQHLWMMGPNRGIWQVWVSPVRRSEFTRSIKDGSAAIPEWDSTAVALPVAPPKRR